MTSKGYVFGSIPIMKNEQTYSPYYGLQQHGLTSDIHFISGQVCDFCNYVDETELSELASKIPANQMQRFVVEILKIPEARFSQISKSEHNDVHQTLLQCLLIWRNQLECQGIDAAQKLSEIEGKYDGNSKTWVTCITDSEHVIARLG